MKGLTSLRQLSSTNIACIVLFLITFIYLFPAFLGYVDTPVDIRNIRMYPWRYHELDQKIQNKTFWQATFPSNKKVFNLTIPPTNTNTVTFQTDWTKLIEWKRPKLSDVNYFVTLDFKAATTQDVSFDLGIKLVNRLTNYTYTPGVGLTPLAKNKDGTVSWYRAFFPLNDFVKQFKNIEDISQFTIQLVVKNKSQHESSLVSVRDFKIACEDFSAIQKVHNHYNNDLIQMFAPFREFFSSSLKAGKLPLWNHYILTGAEFLAEPQVGFFHPLYFLSYLVFDHFTAHEFLTFVCFFLSGIGAYLLARHWGLNFIAALFAALVFMFQPFNVTWSGYEHMIMNSAAMPFLLLFYDKSINEKKIINKYLLLSALILGLIFISGHLQYIYYSAIFFFMFALFRFISSFSVKHLLSIIFIFVIGLMIGSIVIIPFLDLFVNSHRTTNPESLVKATSVPLKSFLGVLFPFYGGYPDWPLSGIINRDQSYIDYKMGFARNYVYFGLLPFFFSLFSLKLYKNKLVLFFTGSIIFSLLICMGSPLFYLFREVLPGFKEMQHYRFLQIYSYCVPFLVGFGFHVFYESFLQLKPKIKTILLTLVFVISVFDLIYFASYFQTWSKRSDFKPVHKGGVFEYLANEKKNSNEHFRVLPFVSHKVEGASLKPDIAEPNTLLPYRLEDVSGYSSFIPKDIYYTFVYIQTMDKNKIYSGDIFDLFSNINTPYPISNFHSKILDLLNVKYFLVPNFLTINSPKVEKVFQSDSTIYKNKNYFPRAFFVPNYKAISNPRDIILKIDSKDFNPKKEVILTTKPDVVLNTSEESNNASVKVTYDTNKIILKANVAMSGFLVLNNNLNHSWKVKINQLESKHYEANLLQRAVYLPKGGEYLVEFYYFPKRFLIGLAITGAALMILLAIWIFLLRNKLNTSS